MKPFPGADPATMMYRITSEDPAPITSLDPQCPPELQTAIQRLLMKRRGDRYQSIEDFLFDTDPVMRNLAREQLPQLMKRAAALMRMNEVDEAQSVVRRILEVDSSNREARKWREELRERARQRAMRPRIEEVMRQADEAAAQSNYRAAIEKIDSALRLDPISTTLQSRLEQLRAGEEQVKRAERLVGEARRDLEREDLTGAIQHVNQAIDADPKNADAPPLLQKVRGAMEEREAQGRLK